MAATDAWKKSKVAFVVSRIGKEGSEERQRSDRVLTHIIKPAVEPLDALRADQDPTPGQITTQIIRSILSSRVVIADLTGGNPNVYYELAVAHSFGRPCVLLIDQASNLGFDQHDARAVVVGDDGGPVLDVELANKARKDLKKQLMEVLKDDYEPQNLVTNAAVARRLEDLGATDPTAKILADIAKQLDSLTSEVRELRETKSSGISLTYDPSKSRVYEYGAVNPTNALHLQVGEPSWQAGAALAMPTNISLTPDGTIYFPKPSLDLGAVAWNPPTALPVTKPVAKAKSSTPSSSKTPSKKKGSK